MNASGPVTPATPLGTICQAVARRTDGFVAADPSERLILKAVSDGFGWFRRIESEQHVTLKLESVRVVPLAPAFEPHTGDAITWEVDDREYIVIRSRTAEKAPGGLAMIEVADPGGEITWLPLFECRLFARYECKVIDGVPHPMVPVETADTIEAVADTVAALRAVAGAALRPDIPDPGEEA